MLRKILMLGISKDDGVIWIERVLEEGDGFCMINNLIEKMNRELSYLSIFVENGDEIDVVYVVFIFYRQYIKYVWVEDFEGWVVVEFVVQ